MASAPGIPGTRLPSKPCPDVGSEAAFAAAKAAGDAAKAATAALAALAQMTEEKKRPKSNTLDRIKSWAAVGTLFAAPVIAGLVAVSNARLANIQETIADQAKETKATKGYLEIQRERSVARWNLSTAVMCKVNGAPFARDVDCLTDTIAFEPQPIGGGAPWRARMSWPAIPQLP